MKRGQKRTRRQKRRDAKWVRARIARDRDERAREMCSRTMFDAVVYPPPLRWLALYE